MKKLSFILAGIIVGLMLIGFINAGCCFNPTNGLCSENSDEDKCTPFGGEFSEKICSSFEKCSEGCCVLGGSTVFSSSRECELLSDSSGFEYPGNFQAITQEECTNLGGSKEVGACLYAGDYEKDCKVQTRSECSTANFYPGLTCTNPQLNTKCKETSNTICYNEDVYTQDSCGNADKIYKDCDYTKGTICAKYQAGQDKKPSIGNYVCRDLNCVDENNSIRKNGESWCAETDPNKVGSEYFRKVCLNGQVSFEPCAPLRNEFCSMEKDENTEVSSAKCKLNDWASCLNAGDESKDCDEEYCKFPNLDEIYPQIASKNDSGFLTENLGRVCLPKIPGGLKFYSSQTGSSENSNSVTTAEGVCSTGNLEVAVRLYLCDDGPNKCNNHQKIWEVAVHGQYDWGKAGLISINKNEWAVDNNEKLKMPIGNNNLVKYYADDNWQNVNYGIPADNQTITILNERCQAMGDCNTKLNWQDEIGSNDLPKKYYKLDCKKVDEKQQIDCTLKYECEPWKAPVSDENCEKCSEGGRPCSEYSCKALGKRCDFYEKEGIGYCMRSTDNSAPVISCAKNGCPKKPVPPYTPVEFAITTDEASECKFNINFAGAKYSEMKLVFDKTFSTDHKVILNLPGQTKLSLFNQDNSTIYSLLKEGKNNLYVRCLDAAGNGETSAPFVIPFEIMKTPDGNAPVILGAEPKSGSKIIFNATQRLVKFKLNEPSECKWSSLDEDYSRMNNTMICDTSFSESSLVLGYFCSTQLTNILNRPGSETKFYVRCKDQPYLEGSEDDLYKRNTNMKSYEYALRPSEKLEILKLDPMGLVTKTSVNRSINIQVTTIGGADAGKAECKWKLFNSQTSQNQSFKKLLNTNSQTHSQPLTNPLQGLNFVEIICNDSSGNIAFKNFNFTIFIDLNAPKITRMFELANILKIKTDEIAACYFSTDTKKGCLFELNNASSLGGKDKDHTLDYEFDTTYFIKCKDNYNNSDQNCGVALKVY